MTEHATTHKRRFAAAGALLASVGLAFLSGCLSAQERLRAHRPEALPEEELRHLLERHAMEEQALREQLTAESLSAPHAATASYWSRQIPLICCRYKHTKILRGRVPWEESSSFLPWHIRSVKPNEQWTYACNRLTIGPFGWPYLRETEAAFDMEGRSFRYERAHTLVVGALWRYRHTRKTREQPEAETVAGTFFTAFGYGQSTRSGHVTTTLRFLWIPIPISRRAM